MNTQNRDNEHICPNCSSMNTVQIDDDTWECEDCEEVYEIESEAE